MRTSQIRKQLHDYIETAEGNKLKAIYTLLQDEISDGYELTKVQRDELDRRYHDHQNGVGQSYTWEETLAMAKQAVVK
ncbi:addiction module protein [Mucilaginibacter flavus]|uniref:addiction module protein n=1 Tax=Mucilaginibacter flavus TaxID=931504 RepID=UPI0025B567DA|nr:addiction module protein [Mucilaginibacter flavus]MDN3580224.1 addiction module protein [Mucilaginibacter flavus]